MPLTPFQNEVARALAANRDAESHVGGGAAINRAETSPRYSADLDLFHDVADGAAARADADGRALTAAGCSVAWELRQPGMYRARVVRGADQLKLEWCTDSPFRFFPAQPDADFGYCLHRADLATNKVLACAGRREVRDFIDIVYIHETYLSLGAVIWAACGKDQGFTPWSLLDMAKRHARFREEELAGENLARPLTLPELKGRWVAAAEQAEQLFDRLPPEDVGCLYVNRDGAPVTPDQGGADFFSLARHFGSPGGSRPKID